MRKYDSYDPFSVCFNSLKLKYKDYDESLTAKDFITSQNDKINVFINLESALKNISTILDLENKIITQRDFNNIIISNIINLAAHYKIFFNNNGLKTKVYLYNTDLSSERFNQIKYNDDFRSYYLNKFNSNPKFGVLTDRLMDNILPNVKTYCEFIPDVYYISAKNIEGSLVPYIISNKDTTRKNLIIGSELYDTQYSFIDNFVNHCICKTYNSSNVYSDLNGYLQYITKKDGKEIEEMISMYDNYNKYCTLMSVIGDKIRSIDGISGCGAIKLIKYLEDGLAQHVISDTSTSPEIIGDIFHDGEMKEEFVNNYYCSSIKDMYTELTDAEKTSILSQITDRRDDNTLYRLNQQNFQNYPLILEGLLV